MINESPIGIDRRRRLYYDVEKMNTIWWKEDLVFSVTYGIKGNIYTYGIKGNIYTYGIKGNMYA